MRSREPADRGGAAGPARSGRAVVLGGYGTFGERICRALARDGRAALVVAGRDGAKARAFAERLRQDFPGRSIDAAELDFEEPRFVRRLGAIAPTVVIHAAGP